MRTLLRCVSIMGARTLSLENEYVRKYKGNLEGRPIIENLIVPVLNRYDLLDRMVSSIDYPVEHLLIIDNGASDRCWRIWRLMCRRVWSTPPTCRCQRTWVWRLHGIWVSSRFRMLNAGLLPRMTCSLHPGALQSLSEARTDEITLSSMFPHWQAFALGYEAVRRVGGLVR